MPVASNAIPYSFYQTMQYQALGALRSVEQKIRVLSDSSSRQDTLLYLARLADAKTANNTISVAGEHVQLEKWINSMFLKVFEFGRDSLSAQEIEEIGLLAHSCPAEKGLGVYYARFLNAYYEPLADYNDYFLCNAAAKGASGAFSSLLSYFNDPSGKGEEQNLEMMANNGIIVYPVPSNNAVSFRSDAPLLQSAKVEIYDLTGREMYSSTWHAGESSLDLILGDFPAGVYSWSVKSTLQQFFGKLVIGQ